MINALGTISVVLGTALCVLFCLEVLNSYGFLREAVSLVAGIACGLMAAEILKVKK